MKYGIDCGAGECTGCIQNIASVRIGAITISIEPQPLVVGHGCQVDRAWSLEVIDDGRQIQRICHAIASHVSVNKSARLQLPLWSVRGRARAEPARGWWRPQAIPSSREGHLMQRRGARKEVHSATACDFNLQADSPAANLCMDVERNCCRLQQTPAASIEAWLDDSRIDNLRPAIVASGWVGRVYRLRDKLHSALEATIVRKPMVCGHCGFELVGIVKEARSDGLNGSTPAYVSVC